jgi:hypothetical protein
MHGSAARPGIAVIVARIMPHAWIIFVNACVLLIWWAILLKQILRTREVLFILLLESLHIGKAVHGTFDFARHWSFEVSQREEIVEALSGNGRRHQALQVIKGHLQ